MSQRSPITTHVLDTARGLPAQGVPVKLFKLDGHGWSLIAEGVTDKQALGDTTTLADPTIVEELIGGRQN